MKSKVALMLAIAILLQPMPGYACRVAYPVQNLADELVSFNSCQDLDAHVNKMQSRNESLLYKGAQMIGARLKRADEGRSFGQAPAASALAMDASMEMAKQDSAPVKVTGTNNQVENVDEADFVKFNGRHIYQIHNGTLKILKAWPATDLNQIASLPVAGKPQEMLMNETTAVVMSAEGQSLKATVIDISQPAAPRLLTEFEIPGSYKTARLVGDTLRIVNQEYKDYEMIQRPEASESGDWFQEPNARKLNIKNTVQTTKGNRREIDVVRNCQNVYVPRNAAPTVLTRIISIDLKAKKYEETMAYIQPDTVYASENAIYLAQTGYGEIKGLNTQQTAIHKFSILKADTARYKASGIVNGHLINQFAMDEHGGHLRIATHGSELKGATFWGSGGRWETSSRVQILAQRGNDLKSIGQTEDLGKGERLYSVRFDGDRGYVVTFRQVDPLYTLDLKNPSYPRVMGELKVPGFSTYIHMLGKNHLLTVGQDADEQTGRVRGLKLSVFDVSNFARPKEVKSLIFKSKVSSESSYEHKAFTFYREKGVLAIPATQGSSRTSLLLFNVTTSDIKAAGEVSMSDLQTVRRSFFADNFVYAIGGLGVRAANLQNPQAPLATVFYDRSLAEAQAGW